MKIGEFIEASSVFFEDKPQGEWRIVLLIRSVTRHRRKDGTVHERLSKVTSREFRGSTKAVAHRRMYAWLRTEAAALVHPDEHDRMFRGKREMLTEEQQTCAAELRRHLKAVLEIYRGREGDVLDDAEQVKVMAATAAASRNE
jgi:hypothetical protein